MQKKPSPKRNTKRQSPKDSRNGEVGSRDIPAAGPAEDRRGDFKQFASVTAPVELDDPVKRKRWGLPALDKPEETGPYIVELNAQHLGGLPGAANAFIELYRQEISGTPGQPQDNGSNATSSSGQPAAPAPVRIAKSYYRCELKDKEWRRLVAVDERKAPAERAIYRLWPDFPVRARTYRSATTIKADAALRSFDAAGEDITWAVIDSGVQGDHLHFGRADADGGRKKHVLWSDAVRDLHRCFADVHEQRGALFVNKGPLPDPDWTADMNPADRKALVEQHRTLALRDDFGHGTHVAGIISGRAPPPDWSAVHVLERQYKMNEDGNKVEETFAEQPLRDNAQLRGMAPLCKLISLRVLDHLGKGRSSQVIQALEYIRERLNDNPKLMRVHGVNLSVGYEFDPEMFACGQSPLCTTVDRLVQEGVVVVAAAGNTGYGSAAATVGTAQIGLSNTINDPGNAAFAITVGSTHRDAPHTYGVSYFSSKGPTADGRLKPDLVAPGERITSCAAGKKLKDTGVTADGMACYIDDTGTSMAAPHVSGAIAAFLSIRREFVGRPFEVKRIFLESATPLGRERYFEGSGLLDLMRAIQSV